MSDTDQQPVCWIIAGPNGAGKTTFALSFLPEVAHCQRFVHADLIAAGLSPFAPARQRISAGRLFLWEVADAEKQRESFGFETTLAGHGYLRLIERLQRTGWHVELVYLALIDSDTARDRVAERVAHGGHHIPEQDIERRFHRSLANLFQSYAAKVDRTRCFLNTEARPKPVFVQKADTITVLDEGIYDHLRNEANKCIN